MLKTIAILLLLTTRLSAQSPVSAPARVIWDQSAPTLADANSYTANLYLDSTTVKTALQGKVCTGTASPFTCSATLPAMTIGRHTIIVTVTAPATATLPAVEGPHSDPFDIVLVVQPAKPVNVRVINP